MTWNETHERIRIFREVEAAAAADMTGAVPWREEWSAYFAGPAGLVTALRARWNHMMEAQLDSWDENEELFSESAGRLRRTQAGILMILQQAQAPADRVLKLGGTAVAGGVRGARKRVRWFQAGPVLHSTPPRRVS